MPIVGMARDSLIFFPNPSRDVLNLYFSADHTTLLSVRILDMSGKTVFNSHTRIEKGQQQWKLPVHQLTPGIYQLQIQDEKQGKLAEKIVVM